MTSRVTALLIALAFLITPPSFADIPMGDGGFAFGFYACQHDPSGKEEQAKGGSELCWRGDDRTVRVLAFASQMACTEEDPGRILIKLSEVNGKPYTAQATLWPHNSQRGRTALVVREALQGFQEHYRTLTGKEPKIVSREWQHLENGNIELRFCYEVAQPDKPVP